MKILNSAFHSTIDNRSKLLFVSGLSGIGKTSLINEIKKKSIF
ncbi:ATP-binding protein [Acaryochloris sp. 'Moss Beach']|nr:ATP-binding protein [Acaryochloris sp. 'Moss Beach']